MQTRDADERYDDDGLDAYEERERRERFAGIGAWGVSLIFHSLAIALLVVLVTVAPWEAEKAPTQVAVLNIPEEREPIERPKLDPTDVTIPQDDPVELPSTNLDITIEDLVVDEVEDPSEAVPNGEPQDVSNMEMSNNAFMPVMGVTSSAPGKRGLPGGGIRNTKRIGDLMGPEGAHVPKVVNSALRWFARHQSPNGQWDVDGYAANCSEGIKCEPGTDHTEHAGDLAATSYAIYCFLGAGYDHRTPNRFRKVVQNGVAWLLSMQQADGMFGKRNYEHPIATMVLAELYAMTNDPKLKQPIQRAVEHIIDRQSRLDDGYALGWNYREPNPSRNDSSVTGWNVMALKSARVAGFSVSDALQGSKLWLQGAWQAANPDWQELTPYDSSKFPYVWNAETGEIQRDNRLAMGGLCAAFLGYRSGDLLLETLVNGIVDQQMPDAYPTNTYNLYYNMMAVFQVGGERWKQWNRQVTPMLIDAQRDDGCFAGSWDFEGTKFHGHEIGRLVSTAYVCLSLEVAVRSLTIEERAGITF